MPGDLISIMPYGWNFWKLIDDESVFHQTYKNPCLCLGYQCLSKRGIKFTYIMDSEGRIGYMCIDGLEKVE